MMEYKEYFEKVVTLSNKWMRIEISNIWLRTQSDKRKGG